MSGLQDENGFSAGGGTEGGEKTARILPSRPNPDAVRAAVEAVVSTAAEMSNSAINVANADFKRKTHDIATTREEGVLNAFYFREAGVVRAAYPVADQIAVIAEIRKHLRAAEIKLASEKTIFKAARGELKGAFKEAVAGVKDAAKSE